MAADDLSNLVDFRTLLAQLISTPVRRRPYMSLGGDLLKGTTGENILASTGQTAIQLTESGGEAPRSPSLRAGGGIGSEIARQATRATVSQALEPILDPEGYQQRVASREAAAEQRERRTAMQASDVARLGAIGSALQSPAAFREYLRVRSPGLEQISDNVFQIVSSLAPGDPETADKIISQIVSEQAKTNIATLEPVFFGQPGGAVLPGKGVTPAVDLSRLMPGARQTVEAMPTVPGAPRGAGMERPGLSGQLPTGPEEVVPGTPHPLGPGGPSGGPLPEGARLLQERVNDYATSIEVLESGALDPVQTLAEATSRGNALAGLIGEQHPIMQESRNRVLQASAQAYQSKLQALTEAQQRGAWDIAVPALSDVRALYLTLRDELPEASRVEQDRMLASLAERQKELWISGDGGPALGIMRPWRWGDVERVVGATMQGALIAGLIRVAAPLVGAGIGFVVGGPPGAVVGSMVGHTVGQTAMPLVMAGSVATQIAVPETEGVMAALALGGVVATPAALPFMFAAPPTLALASRAIHGLEESATGRPNPLLVKTLEANNPIGAAQELINEWHNEPAPFLLKLGAELLTGGVIWHGLKIPFTGIGTPGLRDLPPVSTFAKGYGRFEEYLAERSGLRAREADRYISMESVQPIKDAQEQVRIINAQMDAAIARGEDVAPYEQGLAKAYADIQGLARNWEMRNRVMLSPMPEKLQQHLLRVYDDANPERKGVLAAMAEPWLLLGHHAFQGQVRRMQDDRAATVEAMAAEARWFKERGIRPGSRLYDVFDLAAGEVKPEDIVRALPPPEVLAMELRQSGLLRGDFSLDAIRENLRVFGEQRGRWALDLQQIINTGFTKAGFEKPPGPRGQFWRQQEPLLEGLVGAVRNQLDAMRQVIRAHAEETKRRTGEDFDVSYWDTQMRELTGLIGEFWEQHHQAIRVLRKQALAEGGWDELRFDNELRARIGPMAERLQEKELEVGTRWLVDLAEKRAPVPGVPPERQPAEDTPHDFKATEDLLAEAPGAGAVTNVPPPSIDTVGYGPAGDQAYALRYKVVPLDNIIPSHTMRGTPRPDFDPTLQPRGTFSIEKALSIGQYLLPEFVLSETSRLAEGAPIVRADNMAINNHRIVGFQIARDSYPEKWQEYQSQMKKRARDLGIDEESLAVKDPVLVREVVNEADIPIIKDLANQTPVQTYTPSALAVRDAEMMSDDMLSLLNVSEGQTLRTAMHARRNAGFMNAFLKIVPLNDAPLYVQKGQFTPEGLERVENALLAKVLGDKGQEVVRNFTMTEGEDVRALYDGVMAALPRLALAEGMTRTGRRDPSLAVGDDLAAALSAYIHLRGRGLTVEDADRQRDMFTGQTILDPYGLSPLQRALVLHLERTTRGKRSVKALLEGYANKVLEPSARLEGTTGKESFLRELGVDITRGEPPVAPPRPPVEPPVVGAPREPGVAKGVVFTKQGIAGPEAVARAGPSRRSVFPAPENVDLTLVTQLNALLAYGKRDPQGRRPLVLWAGDEKGAGIDSMSQTPRLEARSLDPREGPILMPTLAEVKTYKGKETAFTERYGKLLEGREVVIDPVEVAGGPVQARDTAARYAQLVFDLGGKPVHPISTLFEWKPTGLMSTAGGRARLAINRGEDSTLYIFPSVSFAGAIEARRERALTRDLKEGKIDQPTFDAQMAEIEQVRQEARRTTELGKESYKDYLAREKQPGGTPRVPEILSSPWEYWERERKAIDQEMKYMHRQSRTGEASPEDVLVLQRRRGLIEMLMTTLADVPMNAQHIERIMRQGISTEEGLLADALQKGRVSPEQAAQLGLLESNLSRLVARRGLRPLYPIGAEQAKAWDRAMFGDGAPIDRASPRGSGPLTTEQEALLSATTDSQLPPELTVYRSPVTAAFPEAETGGIAAVMPPSLSRIYRQDQPLAPGELVEWMVGAVRDRQLDPLQAEAAARGLRAVRSPMPSFLLATATGSGKTFVLASMMTDLARDATKRSVHVVRRLDDIEPLLTTLNDMAMAAKLDKPIDVGIIMARAANLKPYESFNGIRVRSIPFGAEPAQITVGTPARFREGPKENTTLLHPSITNIFLDEAHLYAKEHSQRAEFVQRSMYQAHGWNQADAPRRAGLVLSTATPFEYLDDLRLYRPLFGMFSRQEWDAYENALRSGRKPVNVETRGAPFNRSLPQSALWALSHQVAAEGRSFAFDVTGGEKFVVERLRAPTETLARYDELAAVARDVRSLAYEVNYGGSMMTPFLNAFERVQASMRWDRAMQIAEEALDPRDPKQVIFLTRSISGETAKGGYGRTAIESLRKHIDDKVTIGKDELLTRLDALTKRYETSIGDIGLSPRELVLQHFASRGVADLTGETPLSKRAKERAAFQAGDLAVAVVSDAESTQVDLHHASALARPRVVIPMSVDWSSSTFVQRLGRFRRWGQLSAPQYRLLSLAEDVPTEQRFLGGLVQRLEGMGSMVLGNAKQYLGDDTLDLFSWRPDLARAAVATTLARHTDLAADLFGSSAKLNRFLSAPEGPQRFDVQDFLNGLLFLPREQAKALLDETASRMATLRDDVGEAALRSVPLKPEWIRMERNVQISPTQQVMLSVVHDGVRDALVIDHRAIADPALAASLDLPTTKFFSGWVAGAERDHRTVAGIAVAPRNALAFMERRLSPIDANAAWQALSPQFKLEAVLEGGPTGHVLVLDSPAMGRMAVGPPPGLFNMAFPHPRHLRAVFPERWLGENRERVADALRAGELYVARDTTQEGYVEFFLPIHRAVRWAEQGRLELSDLAALEPGRRSGYGHRDTGGFFLGVYQDILRNAEMKLGASSEGVPVDVPGVPPYANNARNAQVRFADLAQKALDLGRADDAEMYAGFSAFMGKEVTRYAEFYARALPKPLQDSLVESWANLRHIIADRERLASFLVEEAGMGPEDAGRFATDMSTFGVSLLRDLEQGTTLKPGQPLDVGQVARLQTQIMDIGSNLYGNLLGLPGADAMPRLRPNAFMESSSWLSNLVLQQIMRTPSMLLHILETQLALYGLGQGVNIATFVPKVVRARLPFIRERVKQSPDAGEIEQIMGPLIGSDNRGHHAFTLQTGVAGIERDPLADVAGAVSATVSGLFGHGADAARQLAGRQSPPQADFRARWEYWRRRHRGENDERSAVRGFLGQVIASWPEAVTGKVLQNIYNKVEETGRLAFFYRWFPSFHERALLRDEHGAAQALWQRLSQPEGAGIATLEPRLRNAVLHWLHAARGGKSVGQVFDQVRSDFGVKPDDAASVILKGWQEQAIKSFTETDDYTLAQWLSSQKFADRMVSEDMRNSFLIRTKNTMLDEWARRVFPFWNYEVQSPWLWARAFASNPVLFGVYNGWYEEQQRQKRKMLAEPERYAGFQTAWTPMGPVAFNPLVGTYPSKIYRYAVQDKSKNAYDPFDEVSSIAQHFFVPHPFANVLINLASAETRGKEVVAPGQVMAYEPVLAALAQMTSGSNAGFPVISTVEGWLRLVSSGYDHNPFFENDVNRLLAERGIEPTKATQGQRSQAIREAAMWQMARLLTGYRVRRYDQFEAKELGALAADLQQVSQLWQVDIHVADKMTVQDMWDAFRKMPQGAKRDMMEKHPLLVPYLQVGLAFASPQQRDFQTRELRAMSAYEAWRKAVTAYKVKVDQQYGMMTGPDGMMDLSRADVAGWKAAMRGVRDGRPQELQEKRKEILLQYGFPPSSFGDMRELERLAYRGMNPEGDIAETLPAVERRAYQERLKRRPELASLHPWDAAFEQYMDLGPENRRYWLDEQGGAVNYDLIFKERRELLKTLSPEAALYVERRAMVNMSPGEITQRRAMEGYRQALLPQDEGGDGIPRFLGVPKDHERSVIAARATTSEMRTLAGNALAAGDVERAKFWRERLVRYQAERIKTLGVDIRRVRRHPLFKRWLGQHPEITAFLDLPENWMEKSAIAEGELGLAAS